MLFYSLQAETIAFPENVIADASLNWWIIGSSALAGLLLLIILIVILYKCGFFKRKRYQKEQMQSASVHKQDEAHNKLLNSDNGK